MSRLVALVLLTFWPVTVSAQDWQLRTFDDGSFFSASISPSSRPGIALLCGERSLRGLAAAPAGNAGPEVTRPDVLRMFLGADDIGAPVPAGPRRDVMVVLGTTGYAFAEITWNGPATTWQADLPVDDPVFAAIAAAAEFELRSRAGSVMVTGSGFGPAFNALVAHCQRRFAAIGKPWRGAAPPAAPVAPASMRRIAEAAIWQGCGGGATWQPGAFLEGEIDGDGVPDVVLDWREVTCAGAMPRPFCGASMCSADVYLSSVYPLRAQPEGLLALGVRLQPLSNGNMAVAVGGSLGMCRESGTTSCEFLFYWNGADLVKLP